MATASAKRCKIWSMTNAVLPSHDFAEAFACGFRQGFAQGPDAIEGACTSPSAARLLNGAKGELCDALMVAMR